MFGFFNTQAQSDQSTDQNQVKGQVKGQVSTNNDAQVSPKTGGQGSTPAPQTQQKQIGKYKVEVIRSKCISAGSCTAIAPKVFELDEENIAKVISQDGNTDEEKLLAAQSCPTMAIIVTDTTTGEQVWPPAGA